MIETDPDFTQQKRWLSSDYMFNALRYEPNQTQKCLGDGFYEQRLVREQINRLTGRNFVGDYTDFNSQYRGLMDAGITFAQKFNLRPGIALSSDQVAQLTADIVWLETEQVTLPNGKVENVLVPKVYALAKKGDITGNGALLSGNKVIHKGGEFINSGTVAGRESVSTSHTEQTTHQGSELSAGTVTVRATGGDNTIVGSKINAKEATLEGNNVTLLGTTDTQTNRSDNKSSSWSVGVFVGKSGGSTGFGVEGAASVGKGYAQVNQQSGFNINESSDINVTENTHLKGGVINAQGNKANHRLFFMNDICNVVSLT